VPVPSRSYVWINQPLTVAEIRYDPLKRFEKRYFPLISVSVIRLINIPVDVVPERLIVTPDSPSSHISWTPFIFVSNQTVSPTEAVVGL
jgi:hypothetical protein